MKERLKKIKKSGRKVKLIFEYPNTKSAKIRRGYVKRIRANCFDFEEDMDGLVTYTYKYLVEVKLENGK